MNVFFDTSVHIDVLRGALTLGELSARVPGRLRLSPIVAHELLRGARTTPARRTVEHLVSHLVPIEPASWRTAWLEAGRLLPRLFEHHDDVGLARLQNDCLIGLTAHQTGAVLVTRDRHFAALARATRFAFEIV